MIPDISGILDLFLAGVALIAGGAAAWYRGKAASKERQADVEKRRADLAEQEAGVIRHANKTLIRMRDQHLKDLENAKKRFDDSGDRDHFDSDW